MVYQENKVFNDKNIKLAIFIYNSHLVFIT